MTMTSPDGLSILCLIVYTTARPSLSLTSYIQPSVLQGHWGRGRNKLLHIGLAGNHCVFLVSVLAQKVFEWLITNIDNSFLGGVRK